MKLYRSYLTVVLLILVLVLSSCDIDPHKNERPIDIPGSIWVCDEGDYKFIYYVDDHLDVEYRSHFIMNTTEKTYIRFLWSQYDNGVVVYEIDEENGQEKILLSGKCIFDKNMFQINISYVSETITKVPENLCFYRSQIK